MKKKMWNRKLECGHDRLTEIGFLCELYDKPKISDICFCRECNKEVKIIGVEEVKDEKILKEYDKLKKLLRKKEDEN